MGLLIDSAKVDEVRRALGLGWVSGVTTNPSLIAQIPEPAADVIREICELTDGPVFYQLVAEAADDRATEGHRFFDISPKNIVLKIPATTENMSLIARLSPDIPCAATAIFAAHQAYAACAAGARYLIPYVSRATRLLGDGNKLVSEIAAVAAAAGSEAEVVAASIKSPAEATAAVLAGADHLTLPLDVLLAMGDHELSDQALAQFKADTDKHRD